MKNLLLSSVLLLTSAAAFAQLTVKPAGTGPSAIDSYVYVKNQVIYVEGDVTLLKNAVGDTEASIYLREGGQLLQGGIASTNAGDGFLSVQQVSPVNNAWAYNYWCSPVGFPGSGTGAAPGNTNFGVNSIYEDTNAVGGGTEGIGTKAVQSANVPSKFGYTSPKLTISTYWLYQMKTPGTEALANYTPISNLNNAEPGYGFTMKGVNVAAAPGNIPNGSHEQRYEFRGRPNNGDFTIPVMGPAVTGNNDPPTTAVETAKMTLTGNPYPSALDLNKVFHDPQNTTLNAIYYYDENRTIMSHKYHLKPYGYAVWVPGPKDNYVGGVPNGNAGYHVAAAFSIWNQNGEITGPGSGTEIATNYKRMAPIGQGFMFVGNGEDGDIEHAYIKNSHRIYKQQAATNNSMFQRPDADNSNTDTSSEIGTDLSGDPSTGSVPQISQVDTRTPQLRLRVVFDNELSRELLLVFHPQATDGFDRGFDGLSPMGMKTEAFFPIGPDSDRRSYVIQGTNYDARKMIPITFKLHKTSQVQIRAIEEIRKPYEKAYLYDRQENIYRPLLRPYNAAATFTLPAGNYDNRFFIVFRAAGSPRPTGNEDLLDAHALVKADVGMFQNNPARQLEINNPEGYTLKSAYVYDMSGKLVISENNLGDSNRYSFYTGNLSDGVYLVKLITSDDIVIDYKAMVMNK